jgi:toxin ParE1/3/4
MTDQTYEVRIAHAAEADLDGIHAYITEAASKAVADHFLDALVDKAAMLETFPGRGSIPPELAGYASAKVRQIVIGDYRMVYRIDEAKRTVSIIVVAHGRRNLEKVITERAVRTPT